MRFMVWDSITRHARIADVSAMHRWQRGGLLCAATVWTGCLPVLFDDHLIVLPYAHIIDYDRCTNPLNTAADVSPTKDGQHTATADDVASVSQCVRG